MELSRAIEAGDSQAASVCAASLARKQAPLRIQPSEKNYEDTEIKYGESSFLYKYTHTHTRTREHIVFCFKSAMLYSLVWQLLWRMPPPLAVLQ